MHGVNSVKKPKDEFLVHLVSTDTHMIDDYNNMTTSEYEDGQWVVKAKDKHEAWHKAADKWGAARVKKVEKIKYGKKHGKVS